jgi:hypothetical protein
MARQLTRRQIRRHAEERYEREPIYDDPQPRRVSGWEKMMYVIVAIMCLAVLWSAVIAPLLAPLPQSSMPALPTAALPSIQSAPPASSYQQPAVAPQAAPTTPPAPTAIPAAAPPEPVTAPQAGAHPQAEPTAETFGGRRNDREAPPALMGKPRK